MRPFSPFRVPGGPCSLPVCCVTVLPRPVSRSGTGRLSGCGGAAFKFWRRRGGPGGRGGDSSLLMPYPESDTSTSTRAGVTVLRLAWLYV
jgi:hypothetical protein